MMAALLGMKIMAGYVLNIPDTEPSSLTHTSGGSARTVGLDSTDIISIQFVPMNNLHEIFGYIYRDR
jgi:hypothetical protein